MLYQYKKKELEDDLLNEINNELELELPRVAIHSEIIYVHSGTEPLSEEKKSELDSVMDTKGYIEFIDI